MCPDIMSTGFKGASLIIAIDANNERLAMAKKLGADITLNYTQVDALDDIIEAYDLFMHQRDGVLKIAIKP
jgi:threonine dehydrogenase-like Zn-dependent dehydrogenase